MFITLTGPNIAPGDVSAYLGHRSDGAPYVVVNLGLDAALHVHTPEQADALIGAAAEAKRLLDPPVITDQAPATESCGVEIQVIRDDGDDCWVCTEDAGHAGDHIAKDIYLREVHRWPTAAPVITDSERDCDERNPDGSGEPCHRGGDHGVHRDSNGDEWRTDGPGGVLVGPFGDDDEPAKATS